MTPEKLLIELRTLNIRVRVDGDAIRCKVPDGVPTQLAAELRLLKPSVLEVLRTEDDEIAWRVRDLAADLLEQPDELMPGVCGYCGRSMPYGQTGKCVLCAIAAAKLVIDRLNAAGSTGRSTYPSSPDQIEKPEFKNGACDMSPQRKEAA